MYIAYSPEEIPVLLRQILPNNAPNAEAFVYKESNFHKFTIVSAFRNARLCMQTDV